jgi:hypothetical protein
MDAAIANVFLASMFGPDRSSVAPDSWTVHLFVGDPAVDGVEQTGPGYAPASLSSDAFPALAGLTDGSTSALVSFAAASAEWPEDSTHWLLRSGGADGPSGEFSVPVEVGGAGSFPPVLITVFFNDVEEF